MTCCGNSNGPVPVMATPQSIRRRPTIGVGVFVWRSDRRFLIGKRGPECTRGANCWALPGGHVDLGNLVSDTVINEVEEETSIICEIEGKTPYSIPGLLAVTDHAPEGIEHMTFWMAANYKSGEAKVMEPTKCLEWRWCNWLELVELVGKDGYDQTNEQYHWTPLPLWVKILHTVRIGLGPSIFGPYQRSTAQKISPR